MKIENEFLFQGNREKVWEALMDPKLLAKAIPGTESLEQIGEDEYSGLLRVGIGPVSGKFTIQIKLTDKTHPESFKMQISAKGIPGFVNGLANIELTEESENSTLMKYTAELSIGGKIAIVGQRLLDSVGKSMTKQGLEALNKELQIVLKQE